MRKLKFEEGKLSLYKISDDENKALIPLDNEVRQKSLTIESYMSQLLIHADIRSDWMKSREQRSEHTSLLVTIADGAIKALQFEKKNLRKKLDCNQMAGSDICSCTDTK
jgi:hypothetical protein